MGLAGRDVGLAGRDVAPRPSSRSPSRRESAEIKHKKHRVTEITEKLSTKSYTLYRLSFVVNFWLFFVVVFCGCFLCLKATTH